MIWVAVVQGDPEHDYRHARSELVGATLIGMFGRVTKNPAEIMLDQWRTLLGSLGALPDVAPEIAALLEE
jgi:hypothetical protein